MKSAERAEALQCRREGVPYREIAQRLGIAKSTLWRWLRSEGLVASSPQALTERKRIAQRKGAAAVHAKYVDKTRRLLEEGIRQISGLSDRELLLVGTALYWAEGTKQKPHNLAQRVTFTNSNVTMLRLFLRWLDQICRVSRERLTFELSIHTTADIAAARRFWSSALQIPSERLIVRLKRHVRSPHRRNIGSGYVGLIRVTVRQSADLNRRIAGWIDGLGRFVGESANGKPSDFGSEYPGSIPGSPAQLA